MVWAKGAGSAELAELLSDSEPSRVRGDVRQACIDSRAHLVVARKFPGYDGCSAAVPSDFAPDRIDRIFAAVAGGPHTLLALDVGARLGDRLGVPVDAAVCHRPDGEAGALEVVERLKQQRPGVSLRALEMKSPKAQASSLDPGTLMVLGAPGGSWIHRQILGPGVRMRNVAPGGAVSVRAAEPRVYQVMQPPRAIGSHMLVRDVMALTSDDTVAVADHGRLVATVSRHVLSDSPQDVSVAKVAHKRVAVGVDDPLASAVPLLARHGGGPLPVIDSEGVVHGLVTLADIEEDVVRALGG